MKKDDPQDPGPVPGDAPAEKRRLMVALPVDSATMLRRVAQSTRMSIASLQGVIETHPAFEKTANDILREVYKGWRSANDLFKEEVKGWDIRARRVRRWRSRR